MDMCRVPVPWNIHEYDVEAVMRGEEIKPKRTFAVSASSMDEARRVVFGYARVTRGEKAALGHNRRIVHPDGLWGEVCWVVAHNPDDEK
jgi:hypothetical protein